MRVGGIRCFLGMWTKVSTCENGSNVGITAHAQFGERSFSKQSHVKVKPISGHTLISSVRDMAWTLRQGHSSSNNMIDICKGKQKMRNVSQQVRADATGAGQTQQQIRCAQESV